MKILVGDETGLIKYVSYEENRIISKFGSQDKENDINFIEFLQEDNEEDVLTISRQNIVKLFKIDGKSTFSTMLDLKYKDSTVGFNRIPNTSTFVFGNERGQIFKTNFLLDEVKFGEAENLFVTPFEQIHKLKLNPFKSNSLMILSKDTNPQIFDIESKKIVWKARNVKNDYLDLKVPIFDLDVAFHPSQKTAYVSTLYNKIRVYDLAKSNSQPIVDHQPKFEDSPFTNIVLSHCSNYLYVSNHIGSIFELDLRKNMELTGKMKGSTGTIKSMALHKTAPYLGVVGSDRFLRIYNLVLKKMTFKLYLRQKLSTLLFLKEDMIKDVDISDEEDMETVRPMQEKKGLNFLPKKTKKQTIKLAYLKEEELKSEEETPIPKTKKKIKKMAMLKNEDMLSDEEEVPQVKKSKKTYKK